MATNWDAVLKKEQALQKDKLQDLLWFHPGVNRTTAETKLRKAGKKNGVFLVRESLGQLRLSFSFNKKVGHFEITQRKELHYSIESGPVIKGLDELINFYLNGCYNLPTQLSRPVRGELPPPHTFSKGYTNSLHKFLSEKNIKKVKEILEHKRCPDVNSKNDKGSTALHIAASRGLVEAINILLNKKASVETEDIEGYTPLHRAAMQNDPEVVRLLVEEGDADFQYRHFVEGNVPLHEAALRGNTESIKELLRQGACAWARNNKLLTPYELAKKMGHVNSSEYLDNYQPPPARTFKVDWFHDNIGRRGAQTLIEKNGIKDGLFLVRTSSNREGTHVLSFSCNGTAHHYEIKNLQNNAFFVENGPLFPSLEHLVEFYCLHKDGLQCRMSLAISPNTTVVPILFNKELEKLYITQNMTATVTEQGFTEYALASHLSRHGSTSSAGSGDYQIPEPKRSSIFHTVLDGHILKPNSIEMGYELGQGEFGSVLKGSWTSDNGERVDVAIKTLHDEYLTTGRDSFLKEAEIMVKLHHPCIVKLIGVNEGPPLMLVQELVQLGSLLDFLLDYPEKIDPMNDLFLWAAQIASGMLYLENQHFVHRDLAARNILVQSKTQVKVGDFGLSRAVGTNENYYKASKGGRWPVRWYAPESINYGNFSHASDVWSFGITLWEMFTFGDQPYEDKTGAEVAVFLEKKGRLKIPRICPGKVYNDIMMNCWQYDPQKRITCKEILNIFNEFIGTGSSCYSSC